MQKKKKEAERERTGKNIKLPILISCLVSGKSYKFDKHNIHLTLLIE